MPTLNRFPLLGLWAEQAAHRTGYRRDEAAALGHAYAVLYAIRARPRTRSAATAEKPRRPKSAVLTEHFGGDDLAVGRDAAGRAHGLVGGKVQTAASYHANVQAKFPPGYYDALRTAFRDLFTTLPPRRLKTRLVYDLYDQWKKACGVERMVDLDRLLNWCRQRAAASVPPADSTAPARQQFEAQAVPASRRRR